jgi:aminobenzoyl-glutamate transport protein
MEKLLSTNQKKGFLYFVEKVGNKLPHPAIFFALMAVAVLVLSFIGSLLGWEGQLEVEGRAPIEVEAVNLLSRDGIHRIILNMVTNYTGFAPLGIVLVAMLGIGICETSGLLKAAINSLLVKAPKQSITFMVVFTGVVSSIASDVGYVLVIPLAGVIFHSLGRNPLAGMAAAFAGVSAAFTANVIITPLDPMLAGLSTAAAHIVNPEYSVLPTANYFFLVAATFLLSIVGTIVCVKWVEPRLGKYAGNVEREEIVQPTALERKGMRRAGLVFLGWFVLFAIGLIPQNGFLWGDVIENRELICNGEVIGTYQEVVGQSALQTPLLKGIVTFLFLIGISAGAVYGFTVGKFKKAEDIILGMNENFKTLAVYLVLTFFAAQFVAWFNWSNLGMLLAIGGAGTLQSFNIDTIPLILIFTVFTAFLNIFIGSASAKWTILAPVYVPIFMLLGYTPEFAQATYAAGENATNVISPLLPYFPLIIVYFQKYDKKAGIGTIIASMMPYAITFFIAWVGLLIFWVLLNLPLGPNAFIYLQ